MEAHLSYKPTCHAEAFFWKTAVDAKWGKTYGRMFCFTEQEVYDQGNMATLVKVTLTLQLRKEKEWIICR